jgi:hypothetical protein
MDIPLTLTNHLGGDRLFVQAGVTVRGFSGFVNFLIDTGSPYTFISMETLKKFAPRLPLKNLSRIDRTAILGRFLNIVDLGTVVLRFRTETPKIEDIRYAVRGGIPDDLASISTHKPTDMIGLDFLLDNRIGIAFDKQNHAFKFSHSAPS